MVNLLKIINNKQQALLDEQKAIRLYNKELKETNANIIENNNIKWSISVFASVLTTFIALSLISGGTKDPIILALKCIIITVFSLIFGVLIGSKIVMPFYKQLESMRHETESMHLAYLLDKYSPLAVARKGENYLLVLEDKNTKVVVRENINFQYVEKTNINEIILDIDNEKLYVPYRK